MRLLQRLDTGVFSLTEDLLGDDTIPPYAILSHTWVDGQEVTYQDLEGGTVGGKSGYDKLWFCAEQAKRDGLQYFWVDTCCIDKSNHAETSREINAMFRRYRDASRCYVYLSDVSSSSATPWEHGFRASRWFTRGWTLQELLAPNYVEFFSKEHKRLGDKRSLLQQIHEVTGIPQAALKGSRLSQFTVDERFLWAQRRQTTVPEDKVYSLLGIFNAQLLLHYGKEGAEGAERRLRELVDKREKCMQDLCISDPRDDKKRIEQTKGGLLKDSYCWILENSDFLQWHSAQQNALLWVKGNPGKGKTMLLCGVIDELDKAEAHTSLLSYFFCQATDARINNGTAVLRGLVHMLVRQQPSLVSHVLQKYDQVGRKSFEDANAWFALSEIFANILQDPSLDRTYLIIDALDECVTDLDKLLQLIVEIMPTSPRVKWVVSSRNNSDIEAQLSLHNEQRLSLELNAQQISHAVEIFINYKVSRLINIRDGSTLQEQVQNQVREKADGTFLWVALVLQEIERVETWDILEVLKEIPAGLQQLYDRMIRQVQKLERKDPEFCRLVLSTTTLAYRPLHLLELGTLSGLPEQISSDTNNIVKIISKCGSFLTIREGYLYFVHQSAKDYLDSKDLSVTIFPTGRATFHYNLFSQSIQAMSKTLQQDMYKLRLPGILINLAKVPNPDPLASLRYSCIYWESHFQDAYKGSSSYQRDLTDDGDIYRFLQNYFLYWLEALSLIREISAGVLAISSLKARLSVCVLYYLR
jgi:hypothetical protein